MGSTIKDVGEGKRKEPLDGQLYPVQPSPEIRSPLGNGPVRKSIEGKNALSFADILRSRNKFVDALAVYESVLEKDSENVEAHIGKGFCLQMQNLGSLAHESFAEAIRLEPQNAFALTHCGILFKDEGRLVEAAEEHIHGPKNTTYHLPVMEKSL